MKALLPVLLCGLAACYIPQAQQDSNPNPAPGSGTVTTSPGVQGATPSTSTAATPTSTSGTRSITFDTTKKLEYVDIYTDLSDPSSQRALAPYLLKQGEWMLIKCEMLTPTSKHYRFQRVSTADGRALPEVDLFKQGR